MLNGKGGNSGKNTNGGKRSGQQLTFRKSGMVIAAFATLFLIAVSSSAILFSDEEVSAAEVIEGVNYNLNSPSSGKATVVSLVGGYQGDITIPSTVVASDCFRK